MCKQKYALQQLHFSGAAFLAAENEIRATDPESRQATGQWRVSEGTEIVLASAPRSST